MQRPFYSPFKGTFFTGAFLVLSLVVLTYSLQALAVCPDETQGETALDCPWAQVARDLEAQANAGKPIIPALKSELPYFFQQMQADTSRKGWLALWGRSINFDEGAKGIIVHPRVIGAFLSMYAPYSGPIQIVNGRQIVHAGIEHTYGYLFSNLKTSFGYKRARWVRDTLDRGFGMPERVLSPMPKNGTLFSNVTYFTGRIAFRNDLRALRLIESGKQWVSPLLRSYRYDALRVMRLEETIVTSEGRVILRTDFVPFPRQVPGDSNSALLIYSIVDQRKEMDGVPRLITAFPVETAFVKNAFNPKTLGDNQPIVTRYNAYVDGITGRSFTGTRKSY